MIYLSLYAATVVAGVMSGTSVDGRRLPAFALPLRAFFLRLKHAFLCLYLGNAAIDVAITRVSAVIDCGVAVAPRIELLSLTSAAWSAADRADIMRIINSPNSVSLMDLGRASRMIGERTAAAVLQAVSDSGLRPGDVGLVASHGMLCLF